MAPTLIATARYAALVMLRLAVAVTNCVNAEETGAWDILLFGVTEGASHFLFASHGWPELIDRVPGQSGAVNAAWKTALSAGGRRNKGEAALFAAIAAVCEYCLGLT